MSFFASYTCDPGYEFQDENGDALDGPVTIICSQNATWVPETPGRCVREYFRLFCEVATAPEGAKGLL